MLSDKVARLDQLLFAPYEELKNIDQQLLLLALTKEGSILGHQKRTQLKKEYGMDNYQRFETLGDAVLELVIIDKLFDKHNIRLGGFTSKIVNNKSLYCLAWKKKICELLMNPTQQYKDCADVFEAILGVIYIHLKSININPIDFISQWLDDQFNLTAIMNYMIRHPNDENVCAALNNISLSSVISPNTVSTLSSVISPSTLSSVISPNTLSSPTKQESLNTLSTVDLKTLQTSIQRELASRTPAAYKTQLDNFYKQNKLTLPVVYKTLTFRPYQVVIVCPLNLTCNDKSIIGLGDGDTLKDAEERAAQSALLFLQDLLQK